MRTCEKCKKSTIALKDGVCVHCYRKLGSHERVEELTLEEHVRRNYPIGAGVKWKYGTYLAQKEPRTVIRLSWSNRMLNERSDERTLAEILDAVSKKVNEYHESLERALEDYEKARKNLVDLYKRGE